MSAATAKSSLRDRIGVSAPAEAISYLNLLIYGAPGVGKTHFIGTAQDHEETTPLLILDVEGGTTTLRKRKDLDVKRITSIEMLNEVYEMLVSDTEGYYKTVALDSLTELQQLDMGDILAKRDETRPDLKGEPPSMREWGKSADHMRKIVRAFRDLPCHTIMTALEKTDKDDNGTILIMPSLPGKLAAEVPGFLDIVGYLTTNIEKDETIRQLQTVKTRRVTAKDRTSALDPVTESPSIPLLFERIVDSDG